jgi:hypothetical protein
MIAIVGPRLPTDLLSSRLEYLLHLVRHDAVPDAALHGAAESSHLIGERVSRVDHDGPTLDRQETRDRLLGVVAGADVVLALHDRPGRTVGRGENVRGP